MDADELAAVVCNAIGRAVAPLVARIAILEERSAPLVAVGETLAAVRERLAVVETRAPIPGPAGAPGKDGADGLGVDDLAIGYDDERTVTFRAVRGDRVTDFGQVVLPMLIHRGVWTAGQAYVRGDVVSHGGGAWHCQTATSVERPETLGGAPYWKLIVKRGDRGKDAR
jgi:hypothetical protein